MYKTLDFSYIVYRYYLSTFKEKFHEIKNINLDVREINKEKVVLFNKIKIKNINNQIENWSVFLKYSPENMLSLNKEDTWIDAILIYFQNENDIDKLYHLIGMIPYNDNDQLHREIKKLTYTE